MYKFTFSALFLFFIVIGASAQTTKDYAVRLKVSFGSSPYSIRVIWPRDTTAVQYKVFSKSKNEDNWKFRATVIKTDSSYTDTMVQKGMGYEYQVVKITFNFNAYGYIYAGQEVELDKRGKLLLIVDENYKIPLKTEIDQLITDLIAEGWVVKTAYANRSQTPPDVKKLIYNEWNGDTSSLKAVYLLGHVPVPYSGYNGPDGHPEHFGAWPCDLYYSVLDSTQWTDIAINNAGADRPENRNIPGDGKFDLSYIIPGSAKLIIGRVDLKNIPVLTQNDTFLTRRYLTKAHRFKNNEFVIKRRALISDNFGAFGGEAFARGGWINFPGLVGDSIKEGNYRTDMNAGSYLFSYGCGAGSYTSCSGVIGSDNYLTDSLLNPFTALFGSFFGDWDSQNNLMRTSIASKSLTIANAWSGRPGYFYHHMALGESIGFSMKGSMNASKTTYYTEYENNGIHMGLMGDPTLRAHTISPAKNIGLSTNCNRVAVSWNKSDDVTVTGYRIYRSRSLNEDFKLIASVADNVVAYDDSTAGYGLNYYMVKASKLEQTPSGSYYNTSLGVFDSITYKPAPSPQIFVNAKRQCQSDNSFKIKDITPAYSDPYDKTWLLDGQTVSTADSLILHFDTAGNHNVVLVAIAKNGCFKTNFVDITVSGKPVSDISSNAINRCFKGNSFSFNTVNQNDVVYAWKFIGSSDSSQMTVKGNSAVSKSFSNSGDYRVKLTVTDTVTGCFGNSEDTINVYPALQARIILGEVFPKKDIVYSYKTDGPASSTYNWSVSKIPTVFINNDDSVLISWNQLLSARIKVVEKDDKNCVGDTSFLDIWTIVNGLQNVDNGAVSIYPVPLQGNMLTIKYNSAFAGTSHIKVYDAEGRQIMEKSFMTHSAELNLDMQGLRDGIYYVFVENGDKVAVQKVVKAGQR